MKTLAQALPKHLIAFLYGSLLLMAATTYAFANPAMTGADPVAVAESSFASIDTDQDGKVTPEEFFKIFPNMRETAFAAIDKDNDKIISLDEWKAFYVGHSQDTASHSKMMEGSGDASGDKSADKSGGNSAHDGSPDLVMPATGK